jgi:hypothetical protein
LNALSSISSFPFPKKKEQSSSNGENEGIGGRFARFVFVLSSLLVHGTVVVPRFSLLRFFSDNLLLLIDGFTSSPDIFHFYCIK